MPCPECGNCILTFVKLETEYVDEPFSFVEGDFFHDHDPNPIVGTWHCKNGHEFQQRGKRSCSGCFLEQIEATKRAQEAINNTSRPRATGGNDHHHNNFFMNSDHGPGMA
ncbi:Hypothetical protein HVR_LOCUS537 [uncultured virus]|nr:Hypothetical protein HVR_LOCUS537 [uncultured virus]